MIFLQMIIANYERVLLPRYMELTVPYFYVLYNCTTISKSFPLTYANSKVTNVKDDKLFFQIRTTGIDHTYLSGSYTGTGSLMLVAKSCHLFGTKLLSKPMLTTQRKYIYINYLKMAKIVWYKWFNDPEQRGPYPSKWYFKDTLCQDVSFNMDVSGPWTVKLHGHWIKTLGRFCYVISTYVMTNISYTKIRI